MQSMGDDVMDWATSIQRALDHMEDNLLEELSMSEIAEVAQSSPFTFQRAFHILSGYTVGEYIRNRKLSLAAGELQSGGPKVIDVAIKYGYESPESFSRAFERFHGLLPSAARKSGAPLKSFSRLSIHVKLEGGSVMDYRIVQLESFRLLAKVEKQLVSDVKANEFWNRSSKDGTLTTLTALSTSPNKEHIGIADGSSFDGESYLYYLATPYDGEFVPDGYLTMELPERTWVKFRCISLGAENTADAEIWRKIYSEFFPTSDYKPAEYQLEVYPYGDGRYADEIAEVWIAVRRKGEAGTDPAVS